MVFFYSLMTLLRRLLYEIRIDMDWVVGSLDSHQHGITLDEEQTSVLILMVIAKKLAKSKK